MAVQTDAQYLSLTLEEELSRSIRESKVLGNKVECLKTGGKVQTSEERLIDCLIRENINVLIDFNTATGTTNKKNDGKLFCALINLLNEHEDLTRRIKSKKSDFAIIDDAILQTKKKINLVKTKTPTDVDHMERIVKGQQNLKRLEYKLDIASKTYCAIITENNAIRKEIEHLLIERTSFNKLWFGYIANLQQGKKIMMDIIEQATIAYDSRDTWINSLNAFRGWAHFDFQNHLKEMETMQKQLDEKHCIEKFLAIKSQKRSLMNLEQKTIKKCQLLKCEMFVKLFHYKKTLDEIKKFTKIDVEQDQESFIDRYYSFEERNLSLFLYINDLHKDAEDLLTMIVASKINIETQKQMKKQRENKQTITLKILKTKLANTKIETYAAQKKLNEVNITLKKLYTGINKLFQLLHYNKENELLLGNSIEINDYNVLLFYKILEDTIDNLLLNVYLKQKLLVPTGKKQPELIINDKLTLEKIYKIEEIVQVNPCPLCVDHVMVKDVIDTVQYVKTKVEAKELLSKQLKMPDGLKRLHTVSACTLPKSRAIIQKRYH